MTLKEPSLLYLYKYVSQTIGQNLKINSQYQLTILQLSMLQNLIPVPYIYIRKP